MRIEHFVLGELKTNCYMLIEGNACLIIDPADSADFLLEKIQRENLELVGMVGTHGHFDHILAVGEIQLSYDVPFYCAIEDEFLIKRVIATAKHFLGHDPAIIQPQKITPFPEKSTDIIIDTFQFQLLRVPGHTPGSVAFYFPDEHAVFTGDTLFKGAIGRTDLSYSDKRMLRSSIHSLFLLPEETTIYAGHGKETTIGEEKQLLL